ncbi:hypothetical protein WN943_022021 [Citrus x changshan-huyou]
MSHVTPTVTSVFALRRSLVKNGANAWDFHACTMHAAVSSLGTIVQRDLIIDLNKGVGPAKCCSLCYLEKALRPSPDLFAIKIVNLYVNESHHDITILVLSWMMGRPHDPLLQL